jgi:hypothetical protein
MARDTATLYHWTMVNVIEIPFGGPPIVPNDPNACYVWAGTGCPSRGSLAAFQSVTPTKTSFSGTEWMTAIEAAVRDAEKAGVPTVYVVRNA